MSRDIEDAEDLDFTEEEENWNIYKLSDGSILKVKLIIKGVKRMKKWKKCGEPIYLLSTTTVQRLSNIPNEFKRKGKPSAYQSV